MKVWRSTHQAVLGEKPKRSGEAARKQEEKWVNANIGKKMVGIIA